MKDGRNLAIIIPYYKKDFFSECLSSLAKQSNKNFRVYIGNDNSPDSPLENILLYKNQLDIEYISFSENMGGRSLVKQWERCISFVGEEDWIMILGDDDSLSVNCIQAFYDSIDEIEEMNINVVRFASLVIDQNGEELSQIYKHPKIEYATDFLDRKFKGATRSSLSEYLFKKEKLLKIGFKDLPLAWYSDLLAVMEFSEFKEIYTINNAVVKFRLSGKNITAKNDNLILKNIAAFNFYYYLILKKTAHFNKAQIDVLCDRLEKTFFDNKKNRNFWLLYTKLFLSRFYLRRYVLFNFKILKFILNRKIN